MPDFPALVAAELKRARVRHPDFHSHHEVLGVLLDEISEYREEFRRCRYGDQAAVLAELVQLAAVAQRAAESLGLVVKVEV